MLYQLINGNTIEISIDLYLSMSVVDLDNLILSNNCFYAGNVNQYSIDNDLYKNDVEDKDGYLLEGVLDINGELPDNIILLGEDDEDDYIDDYLDFD